MTEIAMHSSIYNHLTYRQDGTAIAYNFLWRTMVLLTPEEATDFTKVLKHDKVLQGSNSETLDIESLCKLKFLVPVEFDEIDFFRRHYFKSLTRPVLTAMILPTLRCNFDCPYCFEIKTDDDLSTENLTALKAWLSSRFGGMRHFHITWFGGEPLLTLSAIEELSRFGLNWASSNGTKFSASIVTNGYLLDRNTIHLLQSLNTHNFHITLDGDRDDHNRTRYLKDTGEGSFERICENIELYCRISRSHLPLGIRVNVTDQNYSGISKLLTRFSNSVKLRSRLYFRWVWTTEASGNKEFVAKQKRPFDRLFELYRLAANAGFLIDNPIDQIQFNYCEVDFAYHYTFDPRGYIYLCGHKFMPKEAAGHILMQPNIEETATYKNWLEANPFSDPTCLACKILPICKGSCRKARVSGGKSCLEEKVSIDKYVESQYIKHSCLSEIA